MPIRASVSNAETLTIRGLDSSIPERQWREWLGDVAELIQERIASDFEKERAAGKALGGVTDEHMQYKASIGAELSKGHMFGDLQDGLNDGGMERITLSRGNAAIRFDQEKLYNRVPHAMHYAKQKVAGGRILVVLQKDARTAEKYLNARAREYELGSQRRSRPARSRRASQRNADMLIEAVGKFLRRSLR